MLVFSVLRTFLLSRFIISWQISSQISWRSLKEFFVIIYLLPDNFYTRMYVFSVTIFRLPRRLEDVLWEVLKTSSRRLRKTSSRRLGRRKIVMLKTCWRRLQGMSWRRLQDVLKPNKCLLGCPYLKPYWYFVRHHQIINSFENIIFSIFFRSEEYSKRRILAGRLFFPPFWNHFIGWCMV